MRHLNWLAAFALATTIGCSDATPGAGEGTEPASRGEAALQSGHHHGSRDVTVMTQNVYVGFDIAPVLAATNASDVPGLVAAAWAQMIGNDFAARAGAIAREVDKAEPDLIGLQEVALFRRAHHEGGDEEIDYLALLQAALAARGLHYVVSVVQQESDVTMPMLAGVDANGPLLDMVQITDRDVILAREGVTTTSPMAAPYHVVLTVPFPGAPQGVSIVRGWVSVVADVGDGRPFRFVTTHLEENLPPPLPPVQVAQASELLFDVLATETRPIVLVGDFNSPADGSQTPTYAELRLAGFADAWAKAHPHAPGYTCCRPADLHQTSPLDQRIDLVLAREPCEHDDVFRGPVHATIVGEKPHDRTASGLWPSDHAGVIASFRLGEGDGDRW